MEQVISRCHFCSKSESPATTCNQQITLLLLFKTLTRAFKYKCSALNIATTYLLLQRLMVILCVLAGWAHVVCALYIPEVEFANVSTMEPIVLQSVPHERYNKVTLQLYITYFFFNVELN